MSSYFESKKWKKDFEHEIATQLASEPPQFAPLKDQSVFVIDTPPPYVNAPIHAGHATTYVLQDIFARFHRLLGEAVIFPLGLDRNGLPIEVAAEKKFKVQLTSLPREEALELCKKILETMSSESVDTFKQLGISFTSWDFHTGDVGEAYLTDHEDYRILTQNTFIDLWNKGLIYFDKRINNYSPGLRTTIADSEIDYKELPSKFVHVTWRVEETDEEITIATTRPELMASCAMVIYHPDDERYQHLEGKHVRVPLYNIVVPLMAHPEAKPEKGSGLVMMCSAGDQTDIRFFRENNLTPIISINLDGKMNSNAGFLEGLHVKKAREAMIEKLQEANLVTHVESITHRTPICERSKQPIEFIEMEEIYLKQKDFLNELRTQIESISFYAPESKQILDRWIEGVNIDWPISRRRFYATEIPLWQCTSCNHRCVPQKSSTYWQPWKTACPIKSCPKCGGTEFEGEKRVFDTWFDSSITVLFNLRYARDDAFRTSHPFRILRPQGKEIVRTWLYYSLLRCYQLTGSTVFNDVWIHHHLVDGKGVKMSKSLNNMIDPKQVLRDYGTEAFRLWTVYEGNIYQSDLRCSFERIKSNEKIINKIWNTARFIKQFNYVQTTEHLFPTDQWIIQQVNNLVEQSKKQFEQYNFHSPLQDIIYFIRETFSSHYLELVKNRAYNEQNIYTQDEQNAACFTLYYVIQHLLSLLAPVVPLLTHVVYKELFNENIHQLTYAQLPYKEVSSALTTEDIFELNSSIWKIKKDQQLGLKDPLPQMNLHEKYAPLEKDIKATHNIKKIKYSQ